MSQHEEQEEERQQSGSGLAWFLMGAAIGAIGAILYAPKSGKETRKFISDTKLL